jgi:hypothetical protein
MRRMFLTAALVSVGGLLSWASLNASDSAPEPFVGESATSDLVGGGKCWTLPYFACPYTSYTCGSQPCSYGLLSGYYCSSSTIQQCAVGGYYHCTQSCCGCTCCTAPCQCLLQVCAYQYGCGGCTMATSGRNAGTYFCNGPFGAKTSVYIFPVQTLSNGSCTSGMQI